MGHDMIANVSDKIGWIDSSSHVHLKFSRDPPRRDDSLHLKGSLRFEGLKDGCGDAEDEREASVFTEMCGEQIVQGDSWVHSGRVVRAV